jgi:DNA-binding winged helix-turn-helix (wHTH) protein
VKFGAFDFDPATRELRRDGAPVRLQPQPAQVLACLLARPGEVVTREELRNAIWGEGTFVDFDRSLNFGGTSSLRPSRPRRP